MNTELIPIYVLYILALIFAILGRFNFLVISVDTAAIISIIIACTGIICCYIIENSYIIENKVKNNDSYNRTN